MPLLLLCALLLVVADDADARRKKRDEGPVRDLHYGEVLFHFYQQDHFGAITRLLAAERQGRLAAHAEQAQLLLGGMYVSYGQQSDAEEIFTELLDTDPRRETRDRAWFYLAKLAYQRAQPARAGRALAQIEKKLPGELQAQRELLSARLLMDAGDYSGAAEELADWDASDEWLDYARFNLGVALVRNGEVDRGTRYLQKIGSGKVDPDRIGWLGRIFTPWRMLSREGAIDRDLTYEDHQALTDKANVALGFAFLQNDRPDDAVRFLSRVEEDSPWSARARLGTGWAHAALGDYEQALAPWQQLESGDPFDPAVQEAHLAVPYALGKLEDYPRAVAQYTAAIDSFNDEMVRLDQVAGATFEGGFLADLLGAVGGDDLGWFWQLERLPDTAETRYLYRLLADHGFQEALKNYRDLRLLRGNLQQWRDGVQAYQDMLAARRTRFDDRVQLMNDSLASGRLERLDARAQRLRDRLAQIETQNDTAGLATANELELMDILARVEQRFAALPADTGKYAATLRELREKHRVLSGVLEWQLNEDFAARHWERTKQLRSLDEALAESHQQTETLLAARDGADERLQYFAGRVDSIAPRVDALIARIDSLLYSHGDYIHALALGTLEQRRDRLRAYLTEAQYALASVYDSAAHGDGQ
jgi:outer membrane protein assembly factor BamD (BamD/ComL family)